MQTITVKGIPVTGKPHNFFRLILWGIFGNADDGPTGPSTFFPDYPYWLRCTLWWIRNPCHNLTFYIIGCADLDHTRTGFYPDAVFAPNGGFNWTYCRVSANWWSFAGSIICLIACLIGVWKLEFWGALFCLILAWGTTSWLFRTLGWMPFVSWQGKKLEAYYGWRERGNFGIKLISSSNH